ncbi:hypothetical protein KRR38_10975 [Novosphingobium sp. G106]|uniref:hypothetical protein n=1 Tax=Novosphingobium sp. G106 TaxID=2849500 RepID=UPI001C2DE2BC|nr:hypothetical protein [Novosphingobium sp. G106]MBV1688181.1 hypothetical protein [Novosphingobium sp. G106]
MNQALPVPSGGQIAREGRGPSEQVGHLHARVDRLLHIGAGLGGLGFLLTLLGVAIPGGAGENARMGPSDEVIVPGGIEGVFTAGHQLQLFPVPGLEMLRWGLLLAFAAAVVAASYMVRGRGIRLLPAVALALPAALLISACIAFAVQPPDSPGRFNSDANPARTMEASKLENGATWWAAGFPQCVSGLPRSAAAEAICASRKASWLGTWQGVASSELTDKVQFMRAQYALHLVVNGFNFSRPRITIGREHRILPGGHIVVRSESDPRLWVPLSSYYCGQMLVWNSPAPNPSCREIVASDLDPGPAQPDRTGWHLSKMTGRWHSLHYVYRARLRALIEHARRGDPTLDLSAAQRMASPGWEEDLSTYSRPAFIAAGLAMMVTAGAISCTAMSRRKALVRLGFQARPRGAKPMQAARNAIIAEAPAGEPSLWRQPSPGPRSALMAPAAMPRLGHLPPETISRLAETERFGRKAIMWAGRCGRLAVAATIIALLSYRAPLPTIDKIFADNAKRLTIPSELAHEISVRLAAAAVQPNPIFQWHEVVPVPGGFNATAFSWSCALGVLLVGWQLSVLRPRKRPWQYLLSFPALTAFTLAAYVVASDLGAKRPVFAARLVVTTGKLAADGDQDWLPARESKNVSYIPSRIERWARGARPGTILKEPLPRGPRDFCQATEGWHLELGPIGIFYRQRQWLASSDHSPFVRPEKCTLKVVPNALAGELADQAHFVVAQKAYSAADLPKVRREVDAMSGAWVPRTYNDRLRLARLQEFVGDRRATAALRVLLDVARPPSMFVVHSVAAGTALLLGWLALVCALVGQRRRQAATSAAHKLDGLDLPATTAA